MNKKPICPYCSGAMRIVVCDDEGNIKSDPETYLKNPWSGLTYGIQHNQKDVPEGYSCPIASFEEDNDLMGTHLYDTENDAYNALFQQAPRFLQKPLEINQIFRQQGVFIETVVGVHSSVCYPALFVPYEQDAPFPSGTSEMTGHYCYRTFGNANKYTVAGSEYGKSWRCWKSCPTFNERVHAGWMNNPYDDEVANEKAALDRISAQREGASANNP